MADSLLKLPRFLANAHWKLLLDRIADKKVVPFLGSGVSLSALANVAHDWADEHKFPLEDKNDLARVAQFMAVSIDKAFPKDELKKHLLKIPAPSFNDPDEPHVALASLPFPLYVTTNFDDYMRLALEARRDKSPRRGLCLWNEAVRDEGSGIDEEYAFREPSPEATPLVYHLHGHVDVPSSMVLTEDDYLDFLISFTENPDTGNSSGQGLIDWRVVGQMNKSSLLLLGYKIDDWDFRILLRIVERLAKRNLNLHISVQLPPLIVGATDGQLEATLKYLDKYFDERKVLVYWGTCTEFISDLMKRWRERQAGAT